MNNKGYITIVEVLVVVAVITIILSLAMVSSNSDYEKNKNRKKVCEKQKVDCRFDCTEEDEKDAMDLCLSKCDIKFDKCNLN